MRKYLSLLFVILLAAGCCRQPAQKDILAKVNNYEITREEFNDELKISATASTDDPQAKKAFLDNLINRKLILQDAQAKGLDRDANFLKMIQHFWEQSLLKLAVEKKANETAAPSGMSSREAREAQARALNDWIADLRKKANIKVNYNLLEEK